MNINKLLEWMESLLLLVKSIFIINQVDSFVVLINKVIFMKVTSQQI